jgi:hypothetical protein
VPTDAVQLRFLLAGDLPLLVASVGETGRGPRLRAALVENGLLTLDGFIGVQLPRGARMAFVIDAQELRLVDERDDTLLRAPRAGIDPDWAEAAKRLRGTMTVVVGPMDLASEVGLRELAMALDERARDGEAIGAIVGVMEERPTLPLLFG